MTGKGHWAQPWDLPQLSAEELFSFGPVQVSYYVRNHIV